MMDMYEKFGVTQTYRGASLLIKNPLKIVMHVVNSKYLLPQL